MPNDQYAILMSRLIYSPEEMERSWRAAASKVCANYEIVESPYFPKPPFAPRPPMQYLIPTSAHVAGTIQCPTGAATRQ